MSADLEVTCKAASIGIWSTPNEPDKLWCFCEAHFSDGSWKRWTYTATDQANAEEIANRLIETRELSLTARAYAKHDLDYGVSD